MSEDERIDALVRLERLVLSGRDEQQTRDRVNWTHDEREQIRRREAEAALSLPDAERSIPSRSAPA
jgi:hypothetical protein